MRLTRSASMAGPEMHEAELYVLAGARPRGLECVELTMIGKGGRSSADVLDHELHARRALELVHLDPVDRIDRRG
jgi:hypothetical protein